MVIRPPDQNRERQDAAWVRPLTARASLIVHYVYDDGVTVCGHRVVLADEDEGGLRCGRCIKIARAQGLIA